MAEDVAVSTPKSPEYAVVEVAKNVFTLSEPFWIARVNPFKLILVLLDRPPPRAKVLVLEAKITPLLAVEVAKSCCVFTKHTPFTAKQPLIMFQPLFAVEVAPWSTS